MKVTKHPLTVSQLNVYKMFAKKISLMTQNSKIKSVSELKKVTTEENIYKSDYKNHTIREVMDVLT